MTRATHLISFVIAVCLGAPLPGGSGDEDIDWTFLEPLDEGSVTAQAPAYTWSPIAEEDLAQTSAKITDYSEGVFDRVKEMHERDVRLAEELEQVMHRQQSVGQFFPTMTAPEALTDVLPQSYRNDASRLVVSASQPMKLNKPIKKGRLVISGTPNSPNNPRLQYEPPASNGQVKSAKTKRRIAAARNVESETEVLRKIGVELGIQGTEIRRLDVQISILKRLLLTFGYPYIKPEPTEILKSQVVSLVAVLREMYGSTKTVNRKFLFERALRDLKLLTRDENQ